MTDTDAKTSTWASRLPDLTGSTFIVTGANSGIGFEAAKALAGRGGHVVFAVRTVSKGQDAAAKVTGSTEVRELNLGDLASVRRFAENWHEPVRALINNAGVMAPPLGRTSDGFELQFGTNHLGHFALTNLLLPRVTDRVVTVASAAHRAGKIDLEDPNWDSRKYSRWSAYGQSKLANLLFTLELQRRLSEAGSTVMATAAHPGLAATNLQSKSGSAVMNAGMALVNRFFAQDARSGALPTLFAAIENIPGASYVGPEGRGGMAGGPTLVGRSAAAFDSQRARELWTLSERLTGVSFPL